VAGFGARQPTKAEQPEKTACGSEDASGKRENISLIKHDLNRSKRGVNKKYCNIFNLGFNDTYSEFASS